MTVAAIIAWITLGQEVFKRGESVWVDIKRVLANHGIDADNAELDRVSLDAARRKGIAEGEINP